MSSQSQPPIPPAAGLRGSPGSPGSPDSPDSPGSPDSPSSPSSPSALSAASSENEHVLTIQDTEVIDATGIGSATHDGSTASGPATGDDNVHHSDQGVPVEPIPPVSDPSDDPVVAAAEEDGSDDPSTDANVRGTDDHDSDRLNDPRL